MSLKGGTAEVLATRNGGRGRLHVVMGEACVGAKEGSEPTERGIGTREEISIGSSCRYGEEREEFLIKEAEKGDLCWGERSSLGGESAWK